MSDTTSPDVDTGVSTRDQLAGAARTSIRDEISLEDFMRAAWAAYTEARPGLKEFIEEQAMRAQLEELRERGQIPLA